MADDEMSDGTNSNGRNDTKTNSNGLTTNGRIINSIDAIKITNGFTTKAPINHPYNNLIYGDTKNKVCFMFSPRAGCTIVFQCYLDLLGLLVDGINRYEQSDIHNYRSYIFNPNVPVLPIQQLIDKQYTFIKFIMNPYIRAVSIYRAHNCHNLTFRQFLVDLANNRADYLTSVAKYHCRQQYMPGEENIVTKYIRVNEYETCNIKLHDESDYVIDVNKYTSSHHGSKGTHSRFCGDTALNDVKDDLPCSYKHFYDDEIRELVDICYSDDVRKYNFTFDF